MFTIRADYSETFEVQASLDKVRDFFTDVKNFIELMPDIESIHTDAKGVIHWKIIANVPLVGSFTEKFSVTESENSDERIEWSPIEHEKYNFLRYVAEFLPKDGERTAVQFSQNIELRRNSATDLHFLAGLAGESIISSEMSKRIAEMLRGFIGKARERLES